MPKYDIKRFFAYWAAMFVGQIIFLFGFVLGVGFRFDVKATIAFFASTNKVLLIILFIFTGTMAAFYSILVSEKLNQSPPSSS